MINKLTHARKGLIKPRIIVFDSGVGGLSVLSEIQQKLPDADYIYVSDNAAFPYGTKPESVLLSRVDAVLNAVVGKFGADMIVIACNTASTLTLPHIRKQFGIPVVGVVPAIKPAAKLSSTKVIGLLATPATVSRPYTQQLIQEFASDCEVILIGSTELVQIAEQKIRGETLDGNAIKHILDLFNHHKHHEKMDVIVLACTHFPLLKAEIQTALHETNKQTIRLIDSGEAIARRVCSLLSISECLPEQPFLIKSHIAVFTADTPQVRSLTPQLADYHLMQIDIIHV